MCVYLVFFPFVNSYLTSNLMESALQLPFEDTVQHSGKRVWQDYEVDEHTTVIRQSEDECWHSVNPAPPFSSPSHSEWVFPFQRTFSRSTLPERARGVPIWHARHFLVPSSWHCKCVGLTRYILRKMTCLWGSSVLVLYDWRNKLISICISHFFPTHNEGAFSIVTLH